MKLLLTLILTALTALPAGAQSFSTSDSKTTNFPVTKTMPYSVGTAENQSQALKAPGGFPNGTQGNSTLKLTHPNGGEVFVAGSDTVITWEGVRATDTVTLEFSNDGGKSWKTLSTTATGLRYVWKNVPQPESDECLIRVIFGKGLAPTITWQKCLGGTRAEQFYSIQEIKKDGYIAVGNTNSNDGDVSGLHSEDRLDYWVVKLSKTGTVQSQKCFGGSQDDFAYCVRQANDGGYFVVGYTYSDNQDIVKSHGGADIWVLKLDSTGTIPLWQKCLGGKNYELSYSIYATVDGGCIIAGSTSSNDGDVKGKQGINNYSDFWVVKLSFAGDIEWQRCFGGEYDDIAYSIQQTSDRGYILAGSTNSTRGDVNGWHGYTDFWVMKLSADGTMNWQKCLGGSSQEEAKSVVETFDGGYIISGWTESNDNDVVGNHGNKDSWVVKLNSLGGIEWQKALGGTDRDGSFCIQQTLDSGYVVAGYTYSNDGDVAGNHNTCDAWVVKLDVSGVILWQKALGGSSYDFASFIQQTSDGGYILAGSSNSNNGDVSGYHGTGPSFTDSWIVKLSPEGTATPIQQDTSDATFSIVMPQSAVSDIDMGHVTVSSAKDSVVVGAVCNIGLYPFRVDSIKFSGNQATEFRLVSGISPFVLQPGDSARVEFRFAPAAVGIRQAQFTVFTQAETLQRTIRGEGIAPPDTAKTLKLTHPNGGEVFVVGSDTVITWEGIAATDTVTLEFSNDNGMTWKTLSTTATGLRHVWKNVPQPASTRCLVQVSQKRNDKIPTIEWQRCLGGRGAEVAHSLAFTKDGGYIVGGYSNSSDGDVFRNKGSYDVWIAKLNNKGVFQIQSCQGDWVDDRSYSVQQTSDGGYIAAGFTYRELFEGSLLLVKVGSIGSLEWLKFIGGSRLEGAKSIREKKDSSFIVAGYTSSTNDIGTGNHGGTDLLLLKVNSVGTVEWSKCFGGKENDGASSMEFTADGGYIIAGYTNSNDGDVAGNHGEQDIWVVKLTENGTIQWQKCLGGGADDHASSVQTTSDGGYIVTGYTRSDDGDITNKKEGADVWVVKLSSTGALEWQKCYGGRYEDKAFAIDKTKDGGYIIAGETSSYDGDIQTKSDTDQDCWVIKLNSSGGLEWQKCIGGRSQESAAAIRQTDDNGYIIAGYTHSSDIKGWHGSEDFYVVKLTPEGEGILQSDTSDATFSIVLPPPDSLGARIQPDTIDFGKVMLGSHRDTLNSVSIFNVGSIPFNVSNIRLVGPNDFTALSVTGSFEIKPSEVLRAIDLRFTPSGIGQIAGRLLFDVSGAATPFEVILTGEGIADTTAVDAILSAPVLAARAGEELTVPIILQDLARVIQSGASRVTVNLRFNSTLLEPIGTTPLGTLSGNDRVIPLDISLKPDAQGVVARLPFRAALGNDSVTVLRLESPAVVGGKVSVSTSAGEFHLLGICYAGGARLLNPGGVVTLALAGQNPVGEQAEIELETTESGTTTLVLFDTGGREVRRYIAGEVSTGRRSVSLDMRGIPAGLYMLTLQTPTETRTAQIRITR